MTLWAPLSSITQGPITIFYRVPSQSVPPCAHSPLLLQDLIVCYLSGIWPSFIPFVPSPSVTSGATHGLIIQGHPTIFAWGSHTICYSKWLHHHLFLQQSPYHLLLGTFHCPFLRMPLPSLGNLSASISMLVFKLHSTPLLQLFMNPSLAVPFDSCYFHPSTYYINFQSVFPLLFKKIKTMLAVEHT